jgi:hypothetical protein
MERWYLDQNKWIDLARADHGRPLGQRFRDFLDLAGAAVERTRVSFPLSLYHFMELSHRQDWSSRIQVAETMLKLSQWHTIANPRDLLAAEIDHALQDRFGRPAVPTRINAFGVGPDHALGRELSAYEPPEEAPLSVEQRQFAQAIGTNLKRVAILLGAPPGFEAPGYDANAHRAVGERFATEQEELRAIRKPEGWHRGDQGRRATSVDTFSEFERSFTAALQRAGLHWGHLYDLGREGMDDLIRAVPIVFAHRELRHLRHEASQQAWAAGDLADLAALAPAVVYCDVVVTERQWCALIKRAKLDERFDTDVSADLAALLPRLATA